MRWSVLRTIWVVLVTALLVRVAAASDPAAQTSLPEQWDVRLSLIEQQLHQNQWENARHLAQALFEELVETSGGTEGDKRANASDLGGAMADSHPSAEATIVGRAAGYRAIAEAALDRREEARWHWYMAQNFLKDVGSLELSRYRKPSEILQRYMLAKGNGQYDGLQDVIDPVRPEDLSGPAFHEPERFRVVYPYLPHDLRHRDRFSHVVFVQLTVDASGRVVQPVVVDGGFYPGLIVRAFDALREWRYRPATLDGRPVAFRYIVPIAFADDRVILPLAEWSMPAPSLGILSSGYALNHVASLAADLQGHDVYVLDKADSRVLRADSRGNFSRFAGTGTSGFNGEALAAHDAQLNRPAAASYDPRTGELLIADTQNYRIRSITPSGELRTVAGVGLRGVPLRLVPNEARTPEALKTGHFAGDGGLATAADLNLPSGVCADPTGILFIADSGNHRIRAVNRGTSPVIVMGVELAPGQIQTIAGTGVAGFTGDGGKAVQAQFDFPTTIKIDAAGNLLILDSFNQRIRRIDRQSAIINTVVHGSLSDVSRERIESSWSTSLAGFAVTANQDIVYADRFDRTVHRLTRAGEDRLIYTALPREGLYTDVEVGPAGEIYVSEKQRIGILRFENVSALTYLDGWAKKPLLKRASVTSSDR